MSQTTWIPCPSCGNALPAQPVSCPHCGIALTGPDAVRLWQVDQALQSLRAERATLLTSLRARAAMGAVVAPRGPAATAAPPSSVATAASAAQVAPAATATPAPPRRAWTTQQTLLAVGVLLVLVASSIALAIAWFIIGRLGQVAVMTGIAAVATAAAFRLSRRGLPSTAEALALVAGGLMLLDVSAARRFGLLNLDAVDARIYTAVSGLLVATLLAGLHRRDTRVAAFAILSLTAASVAWAAVVSFAHTSSAVAALALGGAAAFGLLHRVVPASLGLTRRAATGPAAGWFAFSFAAAATGALAAALDTRPDSGGPMASGLTANGLACVTILALHTTTGAVVTRVVVRHRSRRMGGRAAVRTDWGRRPASGDWRALGVAAAVATVAAPTAVLALALQLGAFWTATMSVIAALLGIGFVAMRPWTGSLGAAWREGQTGAALALLVLVAAVQDSRPATIIALTATATVAAAAAVCRPAWIRPAGAVAATAAVAAAALTGGLVSVALEVLATSAAGVVLVAFALARRARAGELPVGAVGFLALTWALLRALTSTQPDSILIASLSALALAAGAAAVLRPLVRSAAAGVAALAAGDAVWLAGGLVGPRTQWAMLVVVTTVLVGLAFWRRTRGEEFVLGALACLVGAASVAVAVDRSWTHAGAAAAAAYGLVAIGYAALPHRRAVVTAAVVGLTGATWLELARADVHTLEAWTVPLAAFLLAAGLWSRRELGHRSWLTSGPGLAVGLLPSALFTVVDDDVLRPLLTVSVAVLVLVLGAWRRWQALVVLGAAAAVVIAVTQLGPYAVQLPRYLTLGTLGVALLAVGARYEQRRADAKQAVSWLASMS